MQTIRFEGDNKSQKAFVIALRQNVNAYFKDNAISTKGNLTLALQTIVMISCYIVPFIVIMALPVNGWLVLLLMVIMGIGAAGIGMCVMHDAVHGSYSSKDWVNKLMGSTMYLLGSNVFNWKVQHNILHHAYTNIDGYDEDIGAKGPIRLSEYAPLKKIHKYQYIHAFLFYGLMTISKLIKDFSQLVKYNKEGIILKHRINPMLEYTKLITVKLVYLFVFIGLPILFTSFTWWQVLFGFFIMHWTTGCILSTIFQMAHVVEGTEQLLPDNNGVIHCEWAVHELRTTSDFARQNLFLNWYVGGLNFQIEHHLFPNISHVHYRKISPIVERTAKEFGIHYNLKESFVKAFGSHIRRLEALGKPPVSS